MLVHDMTESTFADMYAQTISYGLFSARCMNVEEEIFDPLKAIDNIPDTNPFLRQLLREGLDSQKGNVKKSISFDELELASIIDLLQNTDMKSIVQDFNRQSRSGREDPVIHFYEDFLTEYDKEEKVNRGVFYTPLPVVDFIVRSIDSILKTDFGIKDGLACDEHIIPDGRKKSETVPRVQILDPATGTGTFLRQAILQIKKNFIETHDQEDWSRYVTLSLLHRLYGFELMMAPYAVAHMKIAMALQETGYNFASTTRLKLFLTNSLEEPGDSTGQQSLFEEDPIAVEATQANRIKKEAKINVVMGNPPYSGESANLNIPWIEKLMEDYKKEPGGKIKLNEKNPKWINADEYKFLRFAQYYIENQKAGIIGFICPNTFVTGRTFRGMRWKLANSFDQIYILNLHGNSQNGETSPDGSKDENVFPIQQGVSINIFVKTNKKKNGELAQVYYKDLYGLQELKFEYLFKHQINNVNFELVSLNEPNFYFYPQNNNLLNEYNNSFSIIDVFGQNGKGIVTARDEFTIHNTKEDVEKTIKGFLNTKDDEIARNKYNLGKDVRDWKVEFARNDLKKNYPKNGKFVEISYRLFDKRWSFYTGNSRGFFCYPRTEIMSHFLNGDNLGLVTVSNSPNTTPASYIFITDSIISNGYIRTDTVSIDTVFPLYIYDKDYGKKYPNFNPIIYEKIENIIGKIKPIELFDYIYAVLHIPFYRKKYKEFLKTDFPRIPYPATKEQFFALAKIGGELRELHLMKSSIIDKTPVVFYGTTPSQEVTQKKFDNGKVWINKSEYFEGIPESIWNFYIGGYQVADKWLKDRKGRTLSAEEIKHYERIIKVLMETERLMGELDKIWKV